MANIVNINAEIGANYIGDDAQPSLTFTNSSTGPGLSVDKLVTTSSATISGSATTAPAAVFNKTVLSGPTIELMQLDIGSTASVPAIKLIGQTFVSAVSIVYAASGNWAGQGAIRVAFPDSTTYGWIPVLPSAVVTAAARG